MTTKQKTNKTDLYGDYHNREFSSYATLPNLTKKPKKIKKPETELFLEIETPVYIIEKTAKGKVLSKEPIDSKTVLQLLLHAITEGIDKLDLEDLKAKKKAKNVQKTR